MKILLKSILMTSLLLTFLASCNMDEVTDTEIIQDSEIAMIQYEQIRKILISTKSFKSLSKSLSLTEVVNNNDKTEGTYVYLKSTPEGKVTKEFGYFYNGSGTWIAGNWWSDDQTGASFFVPGSAATQALMNVSGWGNVAKG